MGMFFIIVEESLMLADAARRPSDLHLHHGELTVTPSGVVAQLRGPLAKYSRHFDWPLVSAGLATLRALMDDLRYGESDTFDLVCDRFRLPKQVAVPIADKAMGRIDWHIGPDQEEVVYHESDLIDDVQTIIEWGDTIASRCPNERVARQLQLLPTMSRQKLRQYVSNALG